MKFAAVLLAAAVATATALDTKVPLYVKPSMPAPIPSPSPIPPPAPEAGHHRDAPAPDDDDSHLFTTQAPKANNCAAMFSSKCGGTASKICTACVTNNGTFLSRQYGELIALLSAPRLGELRWRCCPCGHPW